MSIEKYKPEINEWKRTLDYIQVENINLKRRIAEIATLLRDRPTVQKMEHYNTLFLNKDTAISFLRHDIKKLEDQPVQEEEQIRMYKLLRSDMEKMEKEFATLKYNFDDFLVSIAN